MVAAIQRKFLSADVSGRVGEVVATIWQQETEITHARGYFRKLLWRQANHDARGGRRTKMVAVDPHDEAGTFTSLEDAPSDEQILRLADCYERLGATARSVLDAIYWERTQIRVIAEEKKLAYVALSRRVQRIRCELRQCIEQAA